MVIATFSRMVRGNIMTFAIVKVRATGRFAAHWIAGNGIMHEVATGGDINGLIANVEYALEIN